MFAIAVVRVYTNCMFSEAVREPASSEKAPRDAARDGRSVWGSAESVWPTGHTVWTGGQFGPADPEHTNSVHSNSRPVGDVTASAGSRQTTPGVSASDGSDSDDAGLRQLPSRELKELVLRLADERARIEGRYIAAVGELAVRTGTQSVAYVLRDQTRLNGPQARSEAQLGERLTAGGFTDTLDALQAGQIHASHAKVIAREAPKKHRRSETDFLELCRAYPSDLVARYPLAYQSQQVWADLAEEAAAKGLSPIDTEIAFQRHQRRGSMRLGDDGMWHLNAKLDTITGRQLNTAIQTAVRSLRHNHNDINTNASNGSTGDSSDGPTRAQLTADAIANLIGGPAAARNASLLIIADYDVVNDQLTNPRLDDHTPLSARQLAEHALEASILPAVFSADWTQLALGRTRNASDAQRLILAARDSGCTQCELTTEHTQAHHIVHYKHGGTTNIPNLTLLCETCHQHHHQIHGHDRDSNKPEPPSPEPPSPEPPSAARSP